MSAKNFESIKDWFDGLPDGVQITVGVVAISIVLPFYISIMAWYLRFLLSFLLGF